MKKILISLLVIGQLMVPATFAATSNTGGVQTADFLFESDFDGGQVDLLSTEEMNNTEGAIAPLVFAIIGVDLALISVYWGVYIPFIQQQAKLSFQSYSR